MNFKIEKLNDRTILHFVEMRETLKGIDADIDTILSSLTNVMKRNAYPTDADTVLSFAFDGKPIEKYIERKFAKYEPEMKDLLMDRERAKIPPEMLDEIKEASYRLRMISASTYLSVTLAKDMITQTKGKWMLQADVRENLESRCQRVLTDEEENVLSLMQGIAPKVWEYIDRGFAMDAILKDLLFSRNYADILAVSVMINHGLPPVEADARDAQARAEANRERAESHAEPIEIDLEKDGTTYGNHPSDETKQYMEE